MALDSLSEYAPLLSYSVNSESSPSLTGLARKARAGIVAFIVGKGGRRGSSNAKCLVTDHRKAFSRCTNMAGTNCARQGPAVLPMLCRWFCVQRVTSMTGRVEYRLAAAATSSSSYAAAACCCRRYEYVDFFLFYRGPEKGF